MLSISRPRLKTALARPRPRSFFKGQDQDQDFVVKIETFRQKQNIFAKEQDHQDFATKICLGFVG
jgi:hypothetical protein